MGLKKQMNRIEKLIHGIKEKKVKEGCNGKLKNSKIKDNYKG